VNTTDTLGKVLSPDTHRINLQVSDSLGSKAESNITIYVERVGLFTKITSPFSNSIYTPFQPVKFVGSAINGVPPYKFTWISDVDGVIS
ncbi:hypothetical protein NL529_29425, partial [Klebsiella pneumoniae]|nr:hypothetical protein [Klebsiella pneumoniae]